MPSDLPAPSIISIFSVPDGTELDEVTVTMNLSDGKRVDLPASMYEYNSDGNLRVEPSDELFELYDAETASISVEVDADDE